MHVPANHKQATENLIAFIAGWKPDEIIQLGDLMDYPQPSRWSKDTRAEFEGSVRADSEQGKRLLGEIRAVYDGPFRVTQGNHDSRAADYQKRYAPALDFDFSLVALLDFGSHGVELVRGFHEFAPGWVAAHGHLGFTLSQIGGRTALLAANSVGANVVMGHSHRLGLMGESFGHSGCLHTRWGIECGHLMDISKAGYLPRGAANWQTGFCLLYVEGGEVTPVLVPVRGDGSFTVEGYSHGGRRLKITR